MSESLLLADPPEVAAPPENYRIGGTYLRTPPSTDGRAHKLLIGVPYGYEREPYRRYPVVYLCEGYWDFMVVLGLYGSLWTDRVIDEFITVGLAYGSGYPNDPGIEQRLEDMLPAGPETLTSPANTPCCRYLEQVVGSFAPFVEREYRVDPTRRVIAGASIGGVFSLFALLRRPDFFSGAIAVAPCLARGRSVVPRLEAEYFRQHREPGRFPFSAGSAALNARVFLGVGSADDRSVIEPLRAFDRQLDRRRYRGLAKRFWVAEGESHASVKGEGFSRGLSWVMKPQTRIAPPR